MRVRRFVESQHSVLVRFALLLGVVFGLGLLRSNFDPTLSAWGLLQGATVVCLLGLAIATTMIAGELDLSVAATAGVSAIVTAKLLSHGVATAVTVALVAGLVLGLLQGAAIVVFRVKSIVFTLGTMIALGGLQFLITSNGKTVIASDASIVVTVMKRYWIFTPLSLAMLALVVVYQLFLSYSRFGTRLYAFGAARKEALLAGVPATTTTVIVFGISGVLATAAGAATALSSASAVPGGLDPLLLTAVAVALVGGVSLHGGRGGPVSVFVGALLVVGVSNELSARGVSAKSQSLATAGLLLTAVLIEMWGDRRALRPARARTGGRTPSGAASPLSPAGG